MAKLFAVLLSIHAKSEKSQNSFEKDKKAILKANKTLYFLIIGPSKKTNWIFWLTRLKLDATEGTK